MILKRWWRAAARDRAVQPTVEHDPQVPPVVRYGPPSVMPKHRGPTRRLRRRR